MGKPPFFEHWFACAETVSVYVTAPEATSLFFKKTLPKGIKLKSKFQDECRQSQRIFYFCHLSQRKMTNYIL